MIQLNERAWTLVQKTLSDPETQGWLVKCTSQGTFLLDAGCQTPGSLSAGLRMAEIGMAGLGQVGLRLEAVCGAAWPVVEVRSSLPLVACLLSQAAHWPVQVGTYQAMGSGPACLLRKDSQAAQEFGWQEASKRAVLVLEASSLPDEAVCGELAATCGVLPQDLAILIAPTSSLAGSAQIAARSVETALHKLHQIGFDVRDVVEGIGQCPIAPPTGDDRTALGKTNDIMMCGSRVWLAIWGKDSAGRPAEWLRQVPASSSASYGVPFLRAVELAGGFYHLDPGLFAPAEITLTNLSTGQVFRAGGIDETALKNPLGM